LSHIKTFHRHHFGELFFVKLDAVIDLLNGHGQSLVCFPCLVLVL
jgi:hypothetical protein